MEVHTLAKLTDQGQKAYRFLGAAEWKKKVSGFL
jgi:hypothetical protein